MRRPWFNSQQAFLCVEFACFPAHVWVFSWHSDFVPQSISMLHWCRCCRYFCHVKCLKAAVLFAWGCMFASWHAPFFHRMMQHSRDWFAFCCQFCTWFHMSIFVGLCKDVMQNILFKKNIRNYLIIIPCCTSFSVLLYCSVVELCDK